MTNPVTFNSPSPTERELWSGAPKQGIVLRSSDIFFIPFSLMWGGFAFFWEISAIRSSGPDFFPLFGIPFVLAGVYIIIGRFFVDAWQRKNTTYVLTNDHVVIRSGLFDQTVKSLALNTLTDVTITERSNGTGTITFGQTSIFGSMYIGTPWPGMPRVPSFELIPDARMVYDMIRNVQKKKLGVA